MADVDDSETALLLKKAGYVKDCPACTGGAVEQFVPGSGCPVCRRHRLILTEAGRAIQELMRTSYSWNSMFS